MAEPASTDQPLTSEEFDARFLRELHSQFILSLDKDHETFEHVATEHLRMSAVYWSLMAMDLCGTLDRMQRQAIIDFVNSCRCSNGGYSGNVGHDPHLLYTLSAVQILIILDADDQLDSSAIASYIHSLQKPDGSFAGDEFGEIDTRFSYCSLNCLALIRRLDAVDVPAAVQFIVRCRNFDGGFGAVPGAESHAGQIFVCVGALAIADALHEIDADLLGWWLAERQLLDGGLNGRPEKKPDVCYSWWVISALRVIGRMNWIHSRDLTEFILKCQDPEDGGFSDRPGNMSDPFHTFFGIAALSLLGYKQVNEIDPIYAMPARCLRRLSIL